MELWLQIKDALASLLTAKLRTLLAVLGILIGTASVVAMVTSGEIATQQALAQFKTLGTDLMAVNFYIKDPQSEHRNKTLNLAALLKLKTINPAIKTIAPYTMSFVPVIYQGKRVNAAIVGATQQIQTILKIQLAAGRFISDFDGYQHYCTIGSRIADEMRKDDAKNPVGQQIQLGKQIYTVIGIAKPWLESAFFNQNINDSIIIPIKSSYLINMQTRIHYLVISLYPHTNIDDVETQIRKYFYDYNHHVNLFFRSAKKIINSMKKQSQIYTLLLGLIGSISLLVGGIGVMNIMLVSVTERKREIGIRMAIGATRRDIQLLFLTEAVILALFGGVIGILIGIFASYLIAHFANWHFTFFLLPPMIGFIVSAATGIFFGFYPAYKASRLDPIQTLRAE